MGWSPPADLIETSSNYALDRLKEIYPPGTSRQEPFLWTSDALHFLDISMPQYVRLRDKGVFEPTPRDGRDQVRPSDIYRMHEYASKGKRKNPTGQPYVVAVSNLKGGSGKSTLATHSAVWFALRGYRTLLIDADPQGTATTVMGLVSAVDLDAYDEEGGDSSSHPHPLLVKPDESMYQVYEDGIISKTRSTFWNGDDPEGHHLDLIPAVIDDYYSEIVLTDRIAKGEKFHNVLKEAIDRSSVAAEYDVIIIDTPPSFSYTTLNVIYAAHTLLIPVPPHSLDFQATLSYFDKLDEVFEDIQNAYPDEDNRIEMVRVLPVKVETNEETSENYAIMGRLFGDMMAGTPLMASKAFRASSVYNLTCYEGFSNGLFSRKVFREAARSFDDMLRPVEKRMHASWGQFT